MTQKFLLFASPNYYPFGGMHDCHGVFDTLAEAEAAMADINEGYMADCHVLQMPEMLLHDYDSKGRHHSVQPLANFISKKGN